MTGVQGKLKTPHQSREGTQTKDNVPLEELPPPPLLLQSQVFPPPRFLECFASRNHGDPHWITLRCPNERLTRERIKGIGVRGSSVDPGGTTARHKSALYIQPRFPICSPPTWPGPRTTLARVLRLCTPVIPSTRHDSQSQPGLQPSTTLSPLSLSLSLPRLSLHLRSKGPPPPPLIFLFTKR